MTLSVPPAVHARPATPGTRRTARVVGVLYLLTFATSVPTLALYAPLDRPDFVLGAGSSTGVLAGASLEVLLALFCVGTAVLLFPVLRRHDEAATLEFLAARVVEAALILVGVACLLSVVSLRESATRSDPESLAVAGQTLTAVYDRVFLLSQSLMPAISALCLGWVLYRSGLVPRAIPLVGLVGGPLLLVSDGAILWGVYLPDAPLAFLGALPVALWELILGVWLITRGFLPAAEAAYDG
ncbi:DUF4386 domain-containing protein [Nocardioides campestrisoli]|uniref:DUF4386 domain-containing protein n=1 Tax=Nocardioides campestrisoli TaxID=2736757 RepID=UPI0015E7C356|nr:DUF4386 domain-containing protein [Nocardioides campestrisoli]